MLLDLLFPSSTVIFNMSCFKNTVFNFHGRCFSDHFSIFIMLVIICSRGKGQVVKWVLMIQKLVWLTNCVAK